VRKQNVDVCVLHQSHGLVEMQPFYTWNIGNQINWFRRDEHYNLVCYENHKI